jgi:hypothetical protein
VAIRTLSGQERFVSRWTPQFWFAPTSWVADDTLVGTWASANSAVLAVWATSDRDAARPRQILLSRDRVSFWQARVSPNETWISFVAEMRDRPGTLELAVARRDLLDRWTTVARDHPWPDKPRWAPDGRRLYFVSRRPSSFFNLWAVQFDPQTGSAGEPFALSSFDAPSLFVSPEIATAEIGVSAQHAVLTMRSVRGNIWMLDNIDR